jgi:D-alanyl-D-alanine carboxypeptidase
MMVNSADTRGSADRRPAGDTGHGLDASRTASQGPGWPGGQRGRWRARGLCCTAAALMVLCLGGWTGAATGTSGPSGANSLSSALRQDLHQYLTGRRTAEHISAVSLRVTFPDEPSINLAAGTTRYEGGRPVSPAASWQVGSNTKAFTSVIILQLEAAGKLSINDALGKWLPQYPQWKNITIRQLLNMTSRIPDYLTTAAFLNVIAVNPRAVFTARQLVSYAYGLPLLPPGWHYSNTNYILAQMIIEKAAHDSYADQLTRRIIDPLHLAALCLAPYTCPPGTAARLPDGYFLDAPPPLDKLDGTPVPKLALTWVQGSGGIVSSLADLTTWERALYQGHELPPLQQRQLESLVSVVTGQPIAKATPEDPGFGLGVGQADNAIIGTYWYYEGETFGFRVLHIYQPASGVIIALAANSGALDTNDQLSGLLVTVFKTLQTYGALPAH